MKILFYINALYHGGAERVITNVASMMAERDHKCIMVLSYPINNEYHLNKKVEKVYLTNNQYKSFIKRNIILTYRLRNQIKKYKPDIVVSFMAEPNFRICFSKFGLKVKVVLSVRNDPSKEYNGHILSFLAKILFRKADGIVFQTEEAKKWFPTSIQKKGIIIYNSVHEDFYNTDLPKERSGIVAIGRISPQKNHKMLIDAFSIIADKIPDDLTIYGIGDIDNLVKYANEKGIGERIHFPGLVYDVPNTIRQFKIYVMSSDYEGMPNALMEAMAIGLPCISTDCPCGGPRMLFSQDMYEFLVPVSDTISMSNIILKLINSETLQKQHGEACKRQSLLFRPSIINNKWEEYLSSINLT